MSRFIQYKRDMDNFIGREEYITEAYFGKSNELLKAESIFNKIITDSFSMYKKVANNATPLYNIPAALTTYEKLLSKYSNSKELKMIENCFEKQFGFAEMSIALVDGTFVAQVMSLGTPVGPNAFTYTPGLILSATEDLSILPHSQNELYYDKSHSKLCSVTVTAPLMIACNFTADETMAFILHEIGHNFVRTPMVIAGMMGKYLEYYEAIATEGIAKNIIEIALNEFGNIFFKKLGKIVQSIEEKVSNSSLGRLINEIDAISTALMFSSIGVFTKVSFVESIMRGRFLRLLDPKQYILHTIPGYSNEVFADSFATTYGYGPALIRGFDKLDSSLKNHDILSYIMKDVDKESPLFIVTDTIDVMAEIMSMIFSPDPHPSTQTRIINQIKKLETEIKTNRQMTPKQKKACMKDLEHAKKAYNTYLNCDSISRKCAVICLFRKFDDLCGGNIEIRNLFNKIINLGQYQA